MRSGDQEFPAGAAVVVETAHGLDVGPVILEPRLLVHRDSMLPLLPVLRLATDEDLAHRKGLDLHEKEALVLAKIKAKQLGLPMKFSYARYSLDGRKLLLEFTAPERVDFRELLRRLGASLQARIELRQIGARDEAKNVGGIGRCGQTLCCSTWLTKFEAISVRMAKEQSLPVSAEHLAGMCGKLKCCLCYEHETYREMNKQLPKIGSRVTTAEGHGKVIVGHPLKGTVSVLLDRRSPEDAMRTIELPCADVRPE